jgi:hypothetical protein
MEYRFGSNQHPMAHHCQAIKIEINHLLATPRVLSKHFFSPTDILFQCWCLLAFTLFPIYSVIEGRTNCTEFT